MKDRGYLIWHENTGGWYGHEVRGTGVGGTRCVVRGWVARGVLYRVCGTGCYGVHGTGCVFRGGWYWVGGTWFGPGLAREANAVDALLAQLRAGRRELAHIRGG